MVSKLEFQTKVDRVDIEVLWKALTKNKLDIVGKAAPGLLKESQILEGDGHGNIGLGTILYLSFGPDAPNLEPLKEKIVEFDETNHLLSTQEIEGGHMKLGLASYVISIKLDNIGEGNTMITSTLTCDFEKDFDGIQILEEFSKLFNHYINSVASYLQKNNA